MIKAPAMLLALMLAIGSPQGVLAQQGEVPDKEELSKVKQFLFVQNAKSGSYKNGRLILAASGPVIFFSDRPYRIFGHTQASHFVDAWSGGDDSFAANPPNAVLSLLGEEVASFGVVLSEPRYEDGVMSYRAEVDSGTIPAAFGAASLFIDNEAWAAVGGLVVGRHSAKRQQRKEEAAYAEGANASAAQDKNTYYQASAPTASSAASPEQELTELKDLHDKGLISDQEYSTKRQKIVDQI